MKVYLLFLIAFCFYLVLVFNLSLPNSPHWIELAKSFLKGKLYFDPPPPSIIDTAPFNGRYYWPFGPAPAVLITPLVITSWLFKFPLYQGFIQPFLVFAVFFIIYKLAKIKKFSTNDAIFFSLAFCFASPFIWFTLIPGWGYFYYLFSVLFLFLSLFEYYNKKRYWLIGLFCGLALASRFTAGLGIVFFALEILFSNKPFKQKIKDLFSLVLPWLIILILLGVYNYLRFGTLTENGYTFLIDSNYSLVKGKSYGLFSLKHLPSNLYYFLLSTPLPVFRDGISHVLKFPFIKANPWGMSIFITSLYLFYLFSFSYKDKSSQLILSTIIIIAVPIFLYYGTGYRQVGYRYSLDFLPFLFLLLMNKLKEKYGNVPKMFKVLIVISIFLCFYYSFTLIFL